MKFTIVFLLLLLAPACFAQQGWFQLHPNLPGSYTDIAFLSADTGFLVTDNPAKAYQTSDGGLQWLEMSLPTCSTCTYHFQHLFFADKTNGYIIGNSFDGITTKNLLFKTTNSGDSWVLDESQFPHPFTFRVPSETLAFRTERNYFERSIDFGKSWLVTDTLYNSQATYNFDFKDSNDIIAITSDGVGTVVKTSKDGGFNWDYQRVEILQDYTEAYRTVKALCNNVCLIGGERIFRSTNNGSSWAKVSSHHSGQFYFHDTLNGYSGAVYFQFGYILHTVDGGINWSVEHLTDSVLFSAERIATPSATTAYALVNKSILFKTINGGEGQSSVINGNSELAALSIKDNLVSAFADFQFVTNSDPQTICIYDLLGRLILQEHTNADQTSLQVNVKEFHSGIYFARLGNSMLRFIKL